MKTLNVIFTEKEFRKLKRYKKTTGKNWHNLILSMIE
jgi:hypothetical protein